MAKKVHLKLHILEDPIVLEGIKGINLAKQESKLRGHVTGGMAVQSYLPKELNRGTVDVDFRLFWGGTKSNFENVISPLIQYMKESGHEIAIKKAGITYDLNVQKGEDTLVLQHQRISAGNFEKHRHSLDREMANQRIITKGDISFAVMSPEDIVTHKLSRFLKFSEQFGLSYPSNFNELSAEKMKQEADAIRENVIANHGLVEPREIAKLRALYDCADMKNLATYAGLNKKYLLESFVDRQYSSDKPNDWFYKGIDMVGINLFK